MGWSARLARLNASVTNTDRGHGEVCTLYQGGAGQSVDVVMERSSQAVQGLETWEMVTTGTMRTGQVARAPTQGDILEEASGHRWIVDACEEVDGMYVATLRQDPRR
jgi:hypothetical protein